MTYKILDLFAGVCGISLGFESIKDDKGNKFFELYRAAEIDKFACETLRYHHGAEKVIEGDLTDGKIQEKIITECKGKIDIITGGIPCQSFSLIGPRSGGDNIKEKFKQDNRDNLYQEYLKIVNKLLPKIVVIENVKGILSKKDNSGEFIINHIIKDFGKNYTFTNDKNDKKYMLLNAADFGVPQRRERVILVGVRKDLNIEKIPFVKQTHYDSNDLKLTKEDKKNLLPYVTVGEAIGDLPFVEAKFTFTGMNKKEISNARIKNNTIYSGEDIIHNDNNKKNQYIKNLSKSGQEYFNFINNSSIIYHHTARSQQKTDINLFELMQPGETAGDFLLRDPKNAKKLIKYKMGSFKDKYRKQALNKPSTTIFAHLEKDGNRFIHPSLPRTLTPREAARLQSFPDNFIFRGPLSKKYKQIGNAVPPLLARAVALSVYEVLNGNK